MEPEDSSLGWGTSWCSFKRHIIFSLKLPGCFMTKKTWREQIWDQAAALAQCCLVNDSACVWCALVVGDGNDGS